MALRTKIAAIGLLTLSLVSCNGSDRNDSTPTILAQGSGSFPMQGGPAHSEITINIHYHRPHNFTEKSAIVIVLPGDGRNAEDYRDSWIPASEKYGVLVLSPSYPEEYYDIAAYHMGGTIKNLELRNVEFDGTGQIYRFKDDADIVFDANNNKSEWLFHDFDRLFTQVVEAVGSRQERYDLFGHSAGGQVLHRLALFHPGSKAQRIVAANAGFYTLPRVDLALPFGVSPLLTSSDLELAFSERLVLLLGELDDENETAGIQLRTPTADQQGIGRLARGKYFFDDGQTIAAALDIQFNWAIEVVPNVGHDYAKMGKAAAEFLYGNRN